MPRRGKGKDRHRGRVPGDGLPFETAEFDDWFRLHYDTLVQQVQKAHIEEHDASEIVHETFEELRDRERNLWSEYDPAKGATALTWVIKRLRWRISMTYRRTSQAIKLRKEAVM